MSGAGGSRPADTMRGRVPGNRLWLWLLLEANRWVVGGGLVLAVFLSLVVLGQLDPVPLRTAVERSDPVETLFQAFVAAIITGVTLVVSINHVVLSQELGALGDQRERMAGALEFREAVAAYLDAPTSPADPASFLAALLEATGEHAAELGAAVEDHPDEARRARVGAFADEIVENADDVSARLADAQFGTFDVVSAALDFNYSWKLQEARQLAAEDGDRLDAAAEAALDGLSEGLVLYGPAREHVKTLYFQWELINLSRGMLYAAVPALVVASGTILFLDDVGTVTGTTLGIDTLLLVVAAAAASAVSPFLLLASYVLRIATVAKRTLAIGPFVLRDTGDRSPDDHGE